MRVKGEITVEGDDELVHALNKSLPIQEQDRFKASLVAEDGRIHIIVEAEDSTALRAALNSYLRILQAIEKVV